MQNLRWIRVLISLALTLLSAAEARPSAISCGSNVLKRRQAKPIDWNSPLMLAPGPAVSGFGKLAVATGIAPTLTISPASISNDFAGALNLTIKGLPIGAAVQIDRIQVNNTNAIIDPAAIVQATFFLVDGFSSPIPGAVSDTTPADGVISTSVNYNDPFVENMAGEYLYRVSSPTGLFPSTTQRFQVVAHMLAQQMNGVVNAGADPVPYAYVAAVTSAGADHVFVAGAVADANGQYSIPAPAGSYELIASRPGYAGQFGHGAFAALRPGTNSTINPQLERGTRSLSGRAYDLAAQARGIPALQLIARSEDGSQFTVAYSDASGNWSIPVTAGVWTVEVVPHAALAAGYLGLSDPLAIQETQGDVTGLAIGLPPATTVVRGAVYDVFNQKPVSHVAVDFWSVDLKYVSRVLTDENGEYAAPVFPGEWQASIDPELAFEAGYAGLVGSPVDVPAGGLTNGFFHVQALATDVSGVALDDHGAPVTYLSLDFLSLEAGNRSWTFGGTDEEGHVFGAVPEGTFHAIVDLPNADLDLIETASPSFTAQLDSIPQVQLLMKTPSSRWRVRLVDTSGQPISDVPVIAESTIQNIIHRACAWTDEDGIADIGVLDGKWEIHFDQENDAYDLATFGFDTPADPVETIAGADKSVQVTLRSLVAAGSGPALSITRAADGIIASWPATADGFILESAPQVNGPWTQVTEQPVLGRGVLQTTVKTSGSARFFRLRAE